MKFTTKEDIEAPLEDVFRMVSDFETFERSAMRRGADVQRVDSLAEPAVGMQWDASFDMRGRRRNVRVELVNLDPTGSLGAVATSNGLNSSFDVDLLALSPRRTRMSITLELKPQTLSARLLVQSLKLAKANLTKRFKLRVAEQVKDMEDRLRRTA